MISIKYSTLRDREILFQILSNYLYDKPQANLFTSSNHYDTHDSIKYSINKIK